MCQAFRQLLHNALTELFAPKKFGVSLVNQLQNAKMKKEKQTGAFCLLRIDLEGR
jgi:hypothetical protein